MLRRNWKAMPYSERNAMHAECARAKAAENEVLEARRGEAARMQAEREAFWLAQEQPPLGRAKRRKPLSQMPA